MKNKQLCKKCGEPDKKDGGWMFQEQQHIICPKDMKKEGIVNLKKK